jgi:hypothetical protein
VSGRSGHSGRHFHRQRLERQVACGPLGRCRPLRPLCPLCPLRPLTFSLRIRVNLRLSAVKVVVSDVYSRSFVSIRGSLNELVSFQLAELLVFFPGAGI